MTWRGAFPGRKPGTRVRSATWRYAVAKCRSTSVDGTSISRTIFDPGSGRVDTVTKCVYRLLAVGRTGGRLVGEARFELARLATPAPKAGASAVPPLARLSLATARQRSLLLIP